MNLETIHNHWAEDSTIDPTKLDQQSLHTPKLHAKYWAILTNERMQLKYQEDMLRKLRLDKFEFLTQGPTKETVARGWELPPRGVVIKSEADRYIDTDQEVVNLTLKIAMQKEKVALLEDILRALSRRQWEIRNALDYQKFNAGVA